MKQLLKSLALLLLLTSSHAQVLPGAGFITAPISTNGDPFWANVSLLVKTQTPYLADASINNFQFTLGGGQRPSLRTPFAGTGSCFFNGTTNGYVVTTTNIPALGTGDFTYETWLYPTVIGTSNYQAIVDQRNTASQTASVLFGVKADGALMLSFNGSPDITTAPGLITVGVWRHVALVRSSGTVTIYVDGTARASNTHNDNKTAKPLFIGRVYDNAHGPYQGYFYNYRISSNARYTSTFTPQQSPFATDANTILLTFQTPNSLNNSEFLDGSANDFAITRNGNVSNCSVGPALGVGSGYFSGNETYLSGSNAAFSTGTNTFTVEAWVYYNAVNVYSAIFNTSLSTGNDGIKLGMLNTGVPYFGISGGGSEQTSVTGSALSAGQWYHLAGVRNGNNFKLYVNGISVGTPTTVAATAGQSNFTIGRFYTNSAGNTINGYLSSVRFSTVARYTTNFTPSTTYTSDANTVLFLPFSNAGVIDAARKNSIETIGDVAVSTSRTRFGQPTILSSGAGYMAIPAPTSSLVLGTGDFSVETYIYLTSISAFRRMISSTLGAFGAGSFCVRLQSSNKLLVQCGNTSLETTTTIGANTGYQVLVTRQSGTLRIYVNGTLESSVTATDNLSETIRYFSGFFSTNSNEYLIGDQFDIRLTPGVARPNILPSSPFPTN